MPADPEAHPRHELEKLADAVAEVAQIADYLADLALNGDPNADPPVEPDQAAGERVAGEADTFRRWEELLRAAKTTAQRP